MVIELRDVRFAYPEQPQRPVLSIDHWTVAEGERVFVHGPSGSGKSTLLNLLGGLLVPQQGSVTVLDEPLERLSARRRDRFRAANIGYVFQQFNLIPYLDAVDNILLARHFASQRSGAVRDELAALLTGLQLAEAEWHKPVEQLSVGQQQRIAIARALINKPRLLIADEPTSALDQQSRDHFMALLLSLTESHRIALVFVSHDRALCEHFARVDALGAINRVEEVAPCC